MTYRQVIGNLLHSQDKYIVHQTNCVSRGSAAGLARILFSNHPYADCYKDRVTNSVPGTIDIRGNGDNERFIVNLMGQYMPGGIYDDVPTDTETMRINYFLDGLTKLSKMPNLESVAFPAGIGCAIAGGNWNKYIRYIEHFYVTAKASQKLDVTIYCLPMNVEQFSFQELTK